MELIKLELHNESQINNKDKTFQDIIRSYTIEATKKLYDENLKVFFAEQFGILGVYRRIPHAPDIILGEKGFEEFKKNPYASITYNKLFFTYTDMEDIWDRYWNIIIHEISHKEVGVVMNNPETWRLSHPPKFYTAMNRNLRRTKDLKLKFMQELKQLVQ